MIGRWIAIALLIFVWRGDVHATEPELYARLAIPSIGLTTDVGVIYIGRQANGEMTWDTSELWGSAATLDGLGWFGESRQTVVAAHSEVEPGEPDVFFALDQLRAGDWIYAAQDGRVHVYRVTATDVVDPYDLSVLRPGSMAESLMLMTCDTGSYNTSSGLYDERLVIFAEPVTQIVRAHPGWPARGGGRLPSLQR